jgi:hypothetical protein
MLLNYATFKTMPSAVDAPIHILFTHSERVDSVLPGEVNLHEVMATKMRDEDYKYKRLCARNEPMNQHLEGDRGVHMIIHNGDFINTESLLYNRTLTMLDLLLRDDGNLETLQELLSEANMTLRNAYRAAFKNPTIASLLRRNGNIFLSGQGESASFVSSVLAATPPTVAPTKVNPKENVDDDASGSLSRSQSMSQSNTVQSQSVINANNNHLTFEHDADSTGQKDPHAAANEELRMLLMGTILRLAR